MISYAGIFEADLVFALYRSAGRCDMSTPAGIIDMMSGDVTLEQVDKEIHAYDRDSHIRIDYFHGRLLKVDLDMATETFEECWYDRDAGPGTAQRIVDQLRNGR